MADAPKTNTGELAPYLNAGWQLIPLHSYDYFDQHKAKRRPRGKSPLHSNWTKRPYDSSAQLQHMEDNNNVGVRLRAEDLVIDVDPRNFQDGDDPFKRLCEDCGIDPDLYPTVETGSGGLHVYMKKPADVPVRDTLPDYEGVEYKTVGRQVVSAGSLHPDSKKVYVWDFLRPDLQDAPDAPAKLLNLIKRPTHVVGATAGGEHDQEELTRMLDELDPEDFRDHDAWLTLMQSCHHATGGDGRQEFIEWCTRDPEYSDHGALIGRRWDSLHADADGTRVTHRTLHKLLIDAGAEAVIPRAGADEDFDAVGPDDLPHDAAEAADLPDHERKGPMERMNDTYWATMEGGSFKILWQEEDPTMGRQYWVRARTPDFNNLLANRKVQRGEKAVKLSEAWLEWGGRRTARGVVFDPEREHTGFLNLWTGWGVEPRRNGDWSLLRELLRDVLCDGDERVFEYVMDWSAYMVQHPGKPAEVAICFQGGKGCGKGTFGRALTRIAGRHGMQITSSEQLTGRFNDHLRDTILLFADEAIKPYDKDGESRLKAMLTEPVLAFEGKGDKVVQGRNMLHVIMASNEEWFIPAGLEGERRFLLSRANRKWVGKHNKFERLHAQLEDGGYEALLWDLLNRDIGDWAPRRDIPATAGLADQKLRNMGPVAQWWFNSLTEGELPFPLTRGGEYGSGDELHDDPDWETDGVRALKQDVRESFELYCRSNGIRAGGMGRSMDMMFIKEIKGLVPDVKKVREIVPEDRFDVKAHGDGRTWGLEFPPLADCRGAFEVLLGSKLDWGLQT